MSTFKSKISSIHFLIYLGGKEEEREMKSEHRNSEISFFSREGDMEKRHSAAFRKGTSAK